MYIVNEEKRQLIIQLARTEIVLNEFDLLKKKFLPNTFDVYECRLIFLEVDNEENSTKELKPFAQRIDNDGWIMNFEVDEYDFSEVV